MPGRRADPDCPPEFVALALRLADAAGAIVRAYFRTPMAVEVKADRSPVTVADREAEAAMRELIAGAYPGHGILGEEFGATDTEAEFVWVLDPIDGTRSFVAGRPQFGTLIALLRGGEAILGIIDQPVTGERWLGVQGAGATLNGASIRVRRCAGLARAALYTTGPEWFAGEDARAFARLREGVGMCLYGSDCYAFGLLAAGFADLVVERALAPYDYCALIPVVREAGGVISDWQGRVPGLEGDGTLLAAGDARSHAAALALLAG